jgi:hypothetical protein
MKSWEVCGLQHELPHGGRLTISRICDQWWAQIIVGNGLSGLKYKCEAHTIGEHNSVSASIAECERYASVHAFMSFIASMSIVDDQ